MAAAPEAPSWAHLPAACLHEVFRRVPRLADRQNAFRACPRWLEALTEGPRALPSLLFPAPSPYENDGCPRLVCALSGGVHQGLDYPAVIRRGARCFGSHDGGWLFLAVRDPHGHTLLNIRTGATLDLPSNMELGLFNLEHPDPDDIEHLLANLNQDLDLEGLWLLFGPTPALHQPMKTVHAAALSAAPDDAGCVAVCIVRWPSLRCVARWRMGQQVAFGIRPPSDIFNGGFVDAEDVVYHNGAFHLLLSGSHDVLVCTPQLLPDNLSTEAWEYRGFFHPGRRGYDYDQRVRGRYLVSSRGDLLLVVRFAPRTESILSSPTSKFKVFRAILRPHQMPEEIDDPEFPVDAHQMPEEVDDPEFPVAVYPWAWSELDGLDGRIIFVGCGGSRSYELNDDQGRIQYKGFKPDIYFFDDEELSFLDAEQYTCSDNGRWSEPDGVQRCFPPANRSWNSPPAWVLP